MIVNVPQFDPIKDTKLQLYLTYIFFLKASIIGRKKEAAAEKLQEAMDEVGWMIMMMITNTLFILQR